MSDLYATAIENDGMIDPFRFSLICWFNWMNICVPWLIEALFPDPRPPNRPTTYLANISCVVAPCLIGVWAARKD
jgi:hypothetical protein